MIDKEKIKAAVADMTKNKRWRAVLMDAPGAASMRIALAFYATKNLKDMSVHEQDEYRDFRQMLESRLNAFELKYLAEAFGKMGAEPARVHYEDLFGKKPEAERAEGEKQYAELAAKIEARDDGGGEDGKETVKNAPTSAPTGEGENTQGETAKPIEGAESSSNGAEGGKEAAQEAETPPEEPKEPAEPAVAKSVPKTNKGGWDEPPEPAFAKGAKNAPRRAPEAEGKNAQAEATEGAEGAETASDGADKGNGAEDSE